MFRAMKPETIAKRDHARMIERNQTRWAFEANVAKARVEYPQFAFPDTLSESNVLYLEQGERGPKGYAPALTVTASRIKYEDAF